MILRDLSTRKRHDTLWLALSFVLQDLDGPSHTIDVAAALRARLGYAAAETPLVLTWLKKVAPLVPEAAQTGEAVRVYGHIGRRWIWSPRGSAPNETLRQRILREAGPGAMVDDTDW